MMTSSMTTASQCNGMAKREHVEVDIIVPVYNAAATVEEAVKSAMGQVVSTDVDYSINVCVCCFDDGSTDNSWELLNRLQRDFDQQASSESENAIPSRLLLAKSQEGVARGAGYARNRAAELSKANNLIHMAEHVVERFICLLDSDDIMDSRRVAEQTKAMMALPQEERQKTLMGCKVQRDPPDSTWHYTQWANQLTDERLILEKFRECTLLQPTWFLGRSRFESLGGYIEAPNTNEKDGDKPDKSKDDSQNLRLIHPTFDTPKTLRLAEDLRLFHAHLHANGLLRLHRPAKDPNMRLVTYRHRHQSQSFQTSRKLLLHLRAQAFEKNVLEPRHDDGGFVSVGSWPADNHEGKFVVWGAGRDGKDFVKALSEDARKRVYCFVDVDAKKIEQGYYVNQELNLKIPIVHFSLLAKSEEERQGLLASRTVIFGQIDKSKPAENPLVGVAPKAKKQKTNEFMAASPNVVRNVKLGILPLLPVVVCVAVSPLATVVVSGGCLSLPSLTPSGMVLPFRCIGPTGLWRPT